VVAMLLLLVSLILSPDVEAQPPSSYEERFQNTLNEELVKAVVTEEEAQVHKLLAAGANPNTSNHSSGFMTDSATPVLVKAIKVRNYQIIKMLLDAGADPNTVSSHSGFMSSSWKSVIVVAIGLRDRQLIDLLLQAGADPSQGSNSGKFMLGSESQHAFNYLVRTGDLEFIQYFLPRFLPDPLAFAAGLFEASRLDEPMIFRYLLKEAETYMRPLPPTLNGKSSKETDQ